jgi:TonB family protein
MAYVILLSAGIGACALVVEFLFRSRLRATRWTWVSALSAVLVVTAVATFAPLPVSREEPEAAGSPLEVAESVGSAILVPDEPTVTQAAIRLSDAVLPTLWLVSSVLLLAAILYGQRRLHRDRIESRRTKLNGREVLLTDNVGPAVAGVGRPVVLLPRWALALDAASQELLLAHEFEHVKEGDTRVLLTGAIATALMPWNPVAWWISRRLRLAVEQDCDARVLRAHPDVRRYADLLLMAAGRRGMPTRLLSAHFGEHRSDLDRRIESMTDRTIKWRPLVATAVAAGVLLVASCEAPRPEPVAPLGSRETPAVPSSEQYEEIAAPVLVPGSKLPKYPSILREAGVQGNVLVSFDVDETGKADVATFKVIRSTHELFATAVREALPEMRFRPAERDGRKVKLNVEEPFTFTLVRTNIQDSASLTTGTPQEIVISGVQEGRRPTIVLRSDRSNASTTPPNVVVFAFDGKELARSAPAGSNDLLSKIAPETIHSIEVLKGNSCAPYECPLIKITLSKGKTLGSRVLSLPKREPATAPAWEPKAGTAYRRRPDLDSILASPMTVELLDSKGEVVARYGSRREMPRINGEDISASESYHGTSCKAGSACPITKIHLKPGRESAYRKL